MKAYFEDKEKTMETEISRLEQLQNKMDESFATPELHPKYGYGKSRCAKCDIYVRPLDGTRTTPEGRTIPTLRRRVVNIPGNKHVVYDPICPKCGQVLPAVILGGLK